MRARRVKVEFVGLLPTFFNMCAPCCTTDYVKRCGVDHEAEQLSEYPPEAVATQDKASELYARLMRDFGEGILPIAVGLTSPRGLWLSLRHRLGRDLNLVINGHRVLSGDVDYEIIKQVIQDELEEAA